MGFLSSLFETRASVGASVNISNGGDPALAGMFGGTAGTASGQNVNADTALKISTVWACMNRRGKAFAMLPLHVMKELPGNGHEIAKSHRLYKQMHLKPNAWQTSYEWRLTGMTHLQLRGNFYNLKISTPGRGLNQLVPLDPDRMWPFIITPAGVTYYLNDSSPTPPAGSKLFYQYFAVNTKSEIYTADEILHFRNTSTNGIVGKTLIRLMAESVGLSMAMEEQGARLFTNGAQIGKVFTHPAKLDDPAFDRLKKQLDQYSGAANSHRTIILENGMDISSLSMTMQDSQFIESRKFQVEDICSYLDIPMMLIHRSGDKNQTFASAEVIMQMFITLNMQPDFENFEQRLKVDLLYDSEQDYYFNFDFDELMRGDTAARASYYQARLNTGSLTPNDIKRKEGESPYSMEECDAVYIGSGIQAAKNVLNPPEPAAKPEVKVEPKTEDEADGKERN